MKYKMQSASCQIHTSIALSESEEGVVLVLRVVVQELLEEVIHVCRTLFEHLGILNHHVSN